MPSWARASMMRRPAVRTSGFSALRLGDQLVEHGVVEVAPPLLVSGRWRGRGASAASGSSEPPVQSASQGTCGALEVRARPSCRRRAARRRPGRHAHRPAHHWHRAASIQATASAAVAPRHRHVRIGRHPPHEDLVAQGQHRRADEHAQDAGARQAAERAEQDDRHRRIDAPAQQQRLQHVVEHAGDEQQHL